MYRFNPIQFCFQRKPTPHHTKLSPAPRRVASCRSRDTSTNISVQCRPSQVATCSAAQPVIVCRINASMCYFSYFWGELGSNVFRPLGFGHLFGFRQKPDWQRRRQASWPRNRCFFFFFLGGTPLKINEALRRVSVTWRPAQDQSVPHLLSIHCYSGRRIYLVSRVVDRNASATHSRARHERPCVGTSCVISYRPPSSKTSVSPHTLS